MKTPQKPQHDKVIKDRISQFMNSSRLTVAAMLRLGR